MSIYTLHTLDSISLPKSGQQAWLLVNPSVKTTLANFFKNGKNPKIIWLYENTFLSELKDKGPFLVQITNDSILEEYRHSPQKWTAQLIYTKATEQELVEHLRKLLVVRFKQEEKGVLNYFNATVATYFFSMPEEQLSYWLGPIDSLYWYGGDIVANFKGQLVVYNVNNPAPQELELKIESMLTEEQEQSLSNCQRQQILLEWSKVISKDFLDILEYQQEAVKIGFTETVNQNNYIQFRVQFPHGQIPQEIFDQATEQQKLALLQNYWNKAAV